jgi:methylmalonyl-CoA mutase
MGNEKQLFQEFDKVSKSEWEEIVKRDLKGADYKEKLRWNTLEGFSFDPYFTSEDIDEHRPPISTKRGWISCEPLYEESPEEIASIIENGPGLEGVLLRLSLSGDPGASARDLSGVKILSQSDFDRIAEAAKSSTKKLIFDAEMASPAILAMANNSALEKDDFWLIFDPFSHLIEHGRYPVKKDRIIKMLQECVETDNHCLCTDGTLYKQAGATIVEEVAIMLALASEYLAAMPDNKKELAAKSLFFRSLAGPLYFPEMAKLRAIRLLWGLLLEQYGIDKELHLPIFSETSKTNKPLTDSYNNMVRVVSEGMSAVVGGADIMLVHPYNEHYEEPSGFSRRIARNVQHILREEAHLGKVADPAAGSYYIEKMTDIIAEQSWNLFKEIEQQGGFLKSAELGTIQDMVNASSEEKKKAYSTRKRVLVGTNNYPNSSEDLPESKPWNLTAKTLPSDEKQANDTGDERPIISTLTESFRQGASMGEWSNLYYDPERVLYKTIGRFDAGEELDSIRRKTQQLMNSDRQITVQLVQAGNRSWSQARASFSANFLGCAGFKINDTGGFDTLEEALRSADDMKADIFVLCSSDDEAAEMAAPFADAVPEGSILILAGNPGKNEDMFRSEGFEFFIHLKAHLPATLQAILDTLNREETNK